VKAAYMRVPRLNPQVFSHPFREPPTKRGKVVLRCHRLRFFPAHESQPQQRPCLPVRLQGGAASS